MHDSFKSYLTQRDQFVLKLHEVLSSTGTQVNPALGDAVPGFVFAPPDTHALNFPIGHGPLCLHLCDSVHAW